MRGIVALGLVVISAVPAFAQTSQEEVEYYGRDAIGSIRVVFDANGAIVGRLDYGPFGSELRAAAGLPPQRFAGLVRDAEAGLDYAQARSYQLRTGRFSAPDPAFASPLNPQIWNRYSYARSNPVNLTDRSGLCVPGDCPWRVAARALSDSWNWLYMSPAVYGEPVDTIADRKKRSGKDEENDKNKPANDPEDEPPSDPCQRFASELAALGAAARGGNQNVTGAAMMVYAHQKEDPWEGKSTQGFKTDLTQPGQGDDVYRHVMGHAGAILASGIGGAAVSLYEIGKDLSQWRDGKLGGLPEVLGSAAGIRVGTTLLKFSHMLEWLSGTVEDLSKKIAGILCVNK